MLEKISVVIPVYNAAQSLRPLIERLSSVFKEEKNELEIVLVDDCSPDDSWKVLTQLKKEYCSVMRIVRLAMNSGQHNALLCGMSLATGDIIVTMDDDLQHHPEDIPQLIKPILDGYELVIGAFPAKQHHVLRNAGGGFIDRLQRRIFGLPKDFQLTSFRAISKPLAQNVQQIGGIHPYLTAMLLSLTTKYLNVPVSHDARYFGKSNYNIIESLRLAANLILNYSSYLLYLVATLCFFSFLAALIFAGSVVYKVLIGGISVPGWASIMVLMSFYNALIFFVLLIISLYLSRMNRQISNARERFSIAEFHE